MGDIPSIFVLCTHALLIAIPTFSMVAISQEHLKQKRQPVTNPNNQYSWQTS